MTKREALDAPIFLEVIREHGTRRVLDQIFYEVKRLSDRVKVDQRLNLTDDDCADVAIAFIQEFPSESIEDIIICFRMALTGAFGEIFRLDSIVIFTWFRTYLEQKAELMERRHKEAKQPEPETEEEKALREVSQERINEIMKGTWVESAQKDEKNSEAQYEKFKLKWMKKQVLRHGKAGTGHK